MEKPNHSCYKWPYAKQLNKTNKASDFSRESKPSKCFTLKHTILFRFPQAQNRRVSTSPAFDLACQISITTCEPNRGALKMDCFSLQKSHGEVSNRFSALQLQVTHNQETFQNTQTRWRCKEWNVPNREFRRDELLHRQRWYGWWQNWINCGGWRSGFTCSDPFKCSRQSRGIFQPYNDLMLLLPSQNPHQKSDFLQCNAILMWCNFNQTRVWVSFWISDKLEDFVTEFYNNIWFWSWWNHL